MIKNSIYLLFVLLMLSACTEPYPLESTGNLENILVVEARITNQLKPQEIKISRAYELSGEGPISESGAEVFIQDDSGTIYNFEYNNEADAYISINPFQALANKDYQLFVNAAGKEYLSEIESLTTNTLLDSIHVERKIVDGVEGVELSVNSFDPSGTSKYYRYEYEETYKVVTPWYSPYKAIIVGPYELSHVVTDEYSTICYDTEESTKIILNSTVDLGEDKVVNFPIRFINRNNGIISYRYSIEVTQFVESYEAYTYYETLQNLSNEGDVLSPNQPGFITGNITVADHPEEKVIGFFEVVSESSKRIFFDYNELFLNEPLPPYLYTCDLWDLNSLGFSPDDVDGHILKNLILNNSYVLYEFNGAIYTMVNIECGDCASFASPEPPSFWVE